MKREIFVCDRCKAEAETDEEKKALGLGEICLGYTVTQFSYSYPSVYPAHQEWRKQWCQKCREELGIVQEKIQKAATTAPVASLEDLVREIVRNEIGNNQ